MRSTDPPVIVEQIFNTDINTVWKAITVVDQMKLWFFDNITSFLPELGFKTRFEVKSGNRIFTHLWEITEVIPYKKITYNWKYREYPGDSFVTFQLSERPEQVRLVLTNTVTADFPDEIPEFSRESCLGGWNYFLKERLKTFIEE
ncbi:MAG: SRPBCC domain-containing protein [Flavobacteriaceae bacterium]|nr:SRPBCC domain-containing protein [Flavobacteriaceae bacterium]